MSSTPPNSSGPKHSSGPKRGEIWRVRFDPTRGAEIGKERPAIVLNPITIGRLPLRIVVPITGWDPRYRSNHWLIFLQPSRRNGLAKDSAADCFQVKSIALERFQSKLGEVEAEDLEEISAAIAICVGA